MNGYKDNIQQLTLANTNFRKVVFTAPHSQLVLMCLKPKEEIGEEIHEKEDQFFRFEKGNGKVVINGAEMMVCDGDAIVIPAGSTHNVMNTSETESLHFYTIYSPAHHPDGTVHVTKQDALAAESEH
jgi:mannose-6-phosphate isomerase-like protein (cupin superfamily)